MGEERKLEDLNQQELDKFQRIYNGIQGLLVEVMKNILGVIKTDEEYCNEIAPVFNMMIMGALRIKPVDWFDVRSKVDQIMNKA